MDAISFNKSPADLRSPSLREQQKADTRARVIGAAQALFQERGYEAATIRMIAARAGVAPGSVFTTFDSKADLLLDIIFQRYALILEETRRAIAGAEGTLGKLSAAARAAFAADAAEPRLFADRMGASWTWSARAEAAHRHHTEPFRELIIGVLQEGCAAGELRDGLDADLLVEMILACYARVMRWALFDGWSPERMTARLEAQIALILAGCRPERG